MARQLAPLIRWPTTDEVRTIYNAYDIKKFFSKCTCIIDYKEVFIDRPSDLKVQAQTYVDHQHNTVKFLIAVTPKEQYPLFQKLGEEELLTST